jgi:hypothetical protein
MSLVASGLTAGVGSVFLGLFLRKPASDSSIAIALDISRIGQVAHEDRFVDREQAFRLAIREGVIEPAGGAWSYDTDGLYTLTGRGKRIVRDK